jgi:hypothetical protein
MATLDEKWAAYGVIRAVAAHTGDPEIQALADEAHARLMGPPVRHDRYGVQDGERIAHDVAPITRPIIKQNAYARYQQ